MPPEQLFSQQVFTFFAFSNAESSARDGSILRNKQRIKVASRSRQISEDSATNLAPAGDPLLLTQPCLACSLSLSILSTPPPPSGLSSFSVIDSNGRRIERKKFRREFRRRAHQPPPLNVKPPVVFQAPILILSPRINRTDGAFPDIYGPAQKYH